MKIKVKLGTEVKFFSDIGFCFIIVGTILFISTCLLFFLGGKLPLEMKVIYFFEILSKNIYFTSILSLILTLLGLELMKIEKFKDSFLLIDSYKLKFSTEDKIKVIRFNQIKNIVQIKKSEEVLLKITTTKFHKLNFKIDKDMYQKMIDKIPIEVL